MEKWLDNKYRTVSSYSKSKDISDISQLLHPIMLLFAFKVLGFVESEVTKLFFSIFETPCNESSSVLYTSNSVMQNPKKKRIRVYKSSIWGS